MLLGVALMVALFMAVVPKNMDQARQEGYDHGFKEGKASGMTLGIASGYDKAVVEQRAREDSTNNALAVLQKSRR
jgi:flagellar biosynthesis/type III secretory pathway protein FliH